MAEIPKPHVGQVVRYEYLWAADHDQGHEEGSKDRPCAVVLAVRGAGAETRVAVAAITHTHPIDELNALELPQRVKAHLGLDDQRSWVVLTEINEFIWPGPDLRPIGQLPERLAHRLRDRLVANIRQGRLRHVTRTE